MLDDQHLYLVSMKLGAKTICLALHYAQLKSNIVARYAIQF